MALLLALLGVGVTTTGPVSATAVPTGPTQTCEPPAAGTPLTPTSLHGFRAIAPQRLADTRSGTIGPVQVGAGCTLAVPIGSALPAGAQAAALSVTGVDPAGEGWLTAWTCGTPMPGTSNVNMRSGAPTAGMVVVDLGPSRSICIQTSEATALIVDVTGWFGNDAAPFHDIAPVRALDTRGASLRPDGGIGPLAAGVVMRVPLGGLSVPNAAEAVTLNLTVTGSTDGGWLTAWACGEPVPPSSNLNYVVGETRAVQAMIGLGNGALCLRSSAMTHVIVDVSGWYGGLSGDHLATSPPERVVDTRGGIGAPEGLVASGGTVVLDGGGARSLVLGIVAVGATAPGWLVVAPCDVSVPTSAVNFPVSTATSNAVVAPTGEDGTVCITTTAPTHLIVDRYATLGGAGALRRLVVGPGALRVTPTPAGDVHDYAIACAGDVNTITIDATGMPGVQVTVGLQRSGGVSPAEARVVTTLPVPPNDAVVVTATPTGGPPEAYWLRCLPSDFPALTVTRPGQPNPGWYLVAPTFVPAGGAPYLMILDSYGTPVWYRRNDHSVTDFRRLPSGQLSWVPPLGGAFGTDPGGAVEIHELDGTLVKKLMTVGSPTDHHEVQIASDGNWLLLSYKIRTNVDLRALGDTFGPSEEVADCVVQEIDGTGGVVWSWDSADHVDPTETTLPLRFPDGLGGTAVDLVHCNSIDPRPDGSIYLSGRHIDSVLHIDRASGKVVDKIGGTARNKDGAAHFSVVNDPFGGFARQHDARILPNGHLLLFDDRTGLTGSTARAAEYVLNPVNGSASLVWQSISPVPGPACCIGSARRSADGSTVVAWGATSDPVFSELDASGTTVLRVSMPDGWSSYRVPKEDVASFDVSALRATAGLP